jgi:hypothetical protein
MRTKGMMIAVVVLAAAAISVVVSVANAGRGHHNNKVFVAALTEQTHTEATPGAPGPSQGDLYVFAGPLSDRHGNEVGRLDGHCVVTSAPGDPEEDRQQCFVTTTIDSGEQEIQMAGAGRVLAPDVLLSITGGTLRYCGARGEALLDFSVPNTIRVTFERLHKGC